MLFLRFLGKPWYRLAGRAGITVLIQMIAINVGLAAFNLIPIPPLDGSRVLEAFLPFRRNGAVFPEYCSVPPGV